MPRYIDADLIPYSESENGCQDDIAYRYDINEIPTADVEPIVHAHWIRRTHDHMNDYYDVMEYPYRCSACRVKSKELTKRCPECGAKMDERVGTYERH